MTTTQTTEVPTTITTIENSGRITWDIEIAKPVINAGRWTHYLGVKRQTTRKGFRAFYTVWARIEDGQVVASSRAIRLP